MATFSEAVTLPMRKCCTKCGQEKPLTSFYRNKKASDGRHSRCVTCERARRKECYYVETERKYGTAEAYKRLKLREKKSGLAAIHKICARCGEIKLLEDFYKNKKLIDGRNSYCMACDSTMTKEYRARSPKDRLSVSLNTSRTSARRKGIRHELDVLDLIQLWEEQKGICHYTGIRMSYIGDGSPESVSLDRVDSGKGYIQGNVVLCCVYANRMKNDQSVDGFVRWCKLIVDHHKTKNIND